MIMLTKTHREIAEKLTNDYLEVLKEKEHAEQLSKALNYRIAYLEKLLEEEKSVKTQPQTEKAVTGLAGVKMMTKQKLEMLSRSLESVPEEAQFGGTAFIYDVKTKRIRVETLSSLKHAKDLVKKAKSGKIKLVF